MTEIGITTLMLIIANIFCSVTGLNDRLSFERFKFRVDQVLNKKNKERLVSSGFFHVNGLHLAVNVLSLCLFSGGVELLMGPAKYLLIYFAGLIGGNLFSLI
ncbi:MAG: rhomboid family intramembrane serine protease, partial [Aquabacterium sp.]|nr:rhomboid family intramembrane serine protease [Ferruginibacter sp.]